MSTSVGEHPAPVTVTDQIVEIFAEVIGTGEPIDADTDFFEVGGDSILAAKAVVRLRRRLGTTVSMREVFTARTAAALASALGQRVD
jgi:acyl carrier protein